jgi:hypothetical protein
MSEPIRLAREASVAGQAGCATVIGIALTMIGTVIFVLMQGDELRAGDDEWVIYAVGGGWANK